jgi:schlafen family protein
MLAATSGWTLRLRELFGVRLPDVTEEHLRGVVEGQVQEDADLDFKQERYGSTDSQKRALAGDIAAMANDRGGVIVIGIRDEADVAAELTPVEQVHGEEARLRQIAAGSIAPHAQFDIHVVPSAQKSERVYYLLVIPPSPVRPHAVRKDNDLRYPRRDGSTTRWLGESEVADLYRDRFAAATDQVTRAESVLQEGLTQMDMDEQRAYLAVALVPSALGSMSISLARVRQLEEWAVESPGTYAWRGFFGGRPNARAGIRRVRLGSLLAGAPPKSNYAELHTDGAGFACEQAGRVPPQEGGGVTSVQIGNVSLLWEVARSLRILGRHAVENAGAWGDAIVIGRLLGERMNLTYPVHGGVFQEAFNDQPVSGPIDSRHTLPLASLAGADQELLVATRLVAGDLFNAFGAAEVQQIDASGRVRVRYLRADDQFLKFADACSVELSEERVPSD